MALLSPLTDALCGSPAATAVLPWSGGVQAAFVAAKAALSTAALLAHPCRRAQLALVADASATHVRPALQQRGPGSQCWEPLGFFSHKLEKRQPVYSAFDRELLAAYSAI